MAFRADESARAGLASVMDYLVPRPQYLGEEERARSREALHDLSVTLGPVVDAYPSWHPLVRNYERRSYPTTTPSMEYGYKGLDHTRYFVNGFITCPYNDGQEVLDSVQAFPYHPAASVTAERLDVKLYNPECTPILVKCDWFQPLNSDGTIPLRVAMPMLLEMELPCVWDAQVAETWESMRSYFIGRPHGSRSSLFINQETGQAMKKIWEALIYTGMFGPIKV
ncbi:hypothetical protein [Paraburkholderia humisilvae]|uniref:Uncharacterized protein n=1 Tax=Paraburkholderia humisilvae TaxID=627669 RepID=A0A6J5DWV8_9BURK|nr:hypothetical protein [Paraburkholderia humisilvae]CAB3758528.1 hypothetical protein LMG29542_03365 [Paraburkholderia humisilvae]